MEANLARAYRKLGISSRAQLARALDGETLEPFRRVFPPFAAWPRGLPSTAMDETARASSPSASGPDVDDADLATLDRRIERVIADSRQDARFGTSARSCCARTRSSSASSKEAPTPVRDVAERAEIPFERILAAAHSPWPLSTKGGPE